MLKKDFYYDKELAAMLNINIETIRLLCERGNFAQAEKLADGQWIIPAGRMNINEEESKLLQRKAKDFEDSNQKILGDEIDDFDFSEDD